MSKRIFHFLILVVFISACQAQATATAQPDTTKPGEPTSTPELAGTPQPASPAQCRQSILEPTEPIHAVHMTGNWGTNSEEENTLPADYFEYLRDMNVNWVGISVGLHYEDSLDSTVERVYSGVGIPTFRDDFLRELIQTFHQQGFCVYLTLAFEASEAERTEHPFYRVELGQPTPMDHSDIPLEFWPWALEHPDHERFVAEFWETYTEQAVHFGQIAEEEGVGLYSLGTETEGLFRTRPNDEIGWSNDFRDELRAMVAAVREEYSGPLTYDLWTIVFSNPERGFGPGAEYLWEDTGMEVIGLSSYFPMADCPPVAALSIEKLEARWEKIFQDYLIPLQAMNPGRPIVFTEFGYTDSPTAAFHNSADSFVPRVPIDKDKNGLDDGEEMQANIHQALFNVMDKHPGVVSGVFTWEMWMASQEQWASELDTVRSSSIRGRLAEDVIREYYGGNPRSTEPTPIPSSSEASSYLSGGGCEIYDDQFAIEWWNAWTWDSDVNTNSSNVVHSGERAIELILQPWGGVGLSFSELDVSPFNWLVFYIASRETDGQQLGISLGYNGEEISQPLEIANYIEGGRLEPGQWHRVAIPISEINPGGGNVDTINIMKMKESGELTVTIDDIFFAEDEVLPPSNPVYIPTPTPTLSPEQEVSLFLYDDEVGAGWGINTWQGKADHNAESVVHNGQQAIEAELDAWGNFGLWTGSLNTSPYLYLEFYINGGSQGGQQITVMTQQSEEEVANLAISDYTPYGSLPQDEWLRVRIPVEDLNPDNVALTGILIVNFTGGQAPTFYVDDIRFVGAGP